MNLNTTEHIVMARVHRIHALRMLVNPTMLKAYGAVVLGVVLASLVSFANVYANMPSLQAPGQVVEFLVNAVIHTELMVKMILSVLAVVMLLVARDIVRVLPRHAGTWAHA
jgi:hypothetical protein